MSTKNVSNTEKKVSEIKDTKVDFLANLDKVNFTKLEKKIEIKSKIENKASSNNDTEIYIYSDDIKDNQNKRKSFGEVCFSFQRGSFSSFIKFRLLFYKENYTVNDLSLYSIIKNNTDTDKMKKTEEFLKVIKEILSIN